MLFECVLTLQHGTASIQRLRNVFRPIQCKHDDALLGMAAQQGTFATHSTLQVLIELSLKTTTQDIRSAQVGVSQRGRFPDVGTSLITSGVAKYSIAASNMGSSSE